MSCVLAIPVYNEEKNLPEVVRQTMEHASLFSRILLINDGSSDDSAKVIDELCREHPILAAVHHAENRGYGYAMAEAFRAGAEARSDFVITMDCDRQHRPQDLQRFLAVSADVDVVSGSRYLDDSRTEGKAPEDRVEINTRITQKLNRMFGWHLTDAFCGFKRYKLEPLAGTVFQEKGYAFPMEFWAFAAQNRLRIEEIPVSRIYTTDDRTFGEDLDRKRRRYRYYLETLSRSRRRFGN